MNRKKTQSDAFILSLSFGTESTMNECLSVSFFCACASCIFVVIVHCLPYFADFTDFTDSLCTFVHGFCLVRFGSFCCHQNWARRKNASTHTYTSLSFFFQTIIVAPSSSSSLCFFVAVVLAIFSICLLSMQHEWIWMCVERVNQMPINDSARRKNWCSTSTTRTDAYFATCRCHWHLQRFLLLIFNAMQWTCRFFLSLSTGRSLFCSYNSCHH